MQLGQWGLFNLLDCIFYINFNTVKGGGKVLYLDLVGGWQQI